MKKSVRRTLFAVGGLLGVVGLLGGVKAAQIGSMIEAGKSFKMPPETVTSAPVTADDWEAGFAAVGSMVPVRAVVVASEVPGLVRELSVESGGTVQSGAVLVRLDTSIEEAQLSSAEAEAALAEVNVERARALRKASSNTPADLDMAEARAKQAGASVLSIRATIAKKTIRAPFTGRLGIRQVELGQVLAPGTPIVPLQSLDPLYVELFLPQQNLAMVSKGQAVRLTTDAYPADSWTGKIDVIDSTLDAVTRNIRIRALVPNADGRLRPGMFARARVLLPERSRVLTIPGTAVVHAPYGDSVFVIEDKEQGGQVAKVARQQFVRLGERRGDMVAVESGLEVNQTVVTSGAFKLRNGAAVNVDNRLAPKTSTDSKPSDS